MGLYIGSYWVLSLNGRYAPGALGAWGPKWYYWFPKGFAQGKVGYWMVDFYSPIWALDRKFWHKTARDKEDIGDDPVTDVYGWGPKE